MKRIALLLISFFAIFSSIYAQSEEVRDCLKLYAAGKTEAVKQKLLQLEEEYTDDPGIILLQAITSEDAKEAIELYEFIVVEHPQSEWADDAYWRIVQYYAVIDDLPRAKSELEQFRKKYPTSDFIAPANDVVKTCEMIAANLEKIKQNSKNSKTEHNVQNVKSEKKETTKEQTKAKPLENKSKPEISSENRTNSSNKTETKQNTNYSLQVGVYSTQESAQKEKERYKKLRFKSDIVPKKVDGIIMHAVIIGNYKTIEAAEKDKSLVEKHCNCKPLIYKKVVSQVDEDEE